MCLAQSVSIVLTLRITVNSNFLVILHKSSEVLPRLDTDAGLLGGWRYGPSQRSIAFSGDAVPNYEDVIDVYYLPQHDRSDNVGRPLPF